MTFGEDWVVRYIRHRLASGGNAIIVANGPTGSGKSWSMLRIARGVMPSFNVSNVVFSLEGLLDLLNEDGRLNYGDVVLWDETGIGAAARKAMQETGKIFSMLLESFRYRRVALLMSVPALAMLDVQAQRLMHLLIECAGARTDHRVKCRVFIVSQMNREDKVIYYHPKIWEPDKQPYKLDVILVGPPDAELAKAYETAREAHIAQVYRGFRDDLRFKGTQLEKTRQRRDEAIYAMRLEGKSVDEIAAAFGITQSRVRQVVAVEGLKHRARDGAETALQGTTPQEAP
jgi:hypothetical protein